MKRFVSIISLIFLLLLPEAALIQWEKDMKVTQYAGFRK